MHAVFSGFVHSFILKNPGKKTIVYSTHEITPLQIQTKIAGHRYLAWQLQCKITNHLLFYCLGGGGEG
jgi:hypothetical protein